MFFDLHNTKLHTPYSLNVTVNPEEPEQIKLKHVVTAVVSNSAFLMIMQL